MKLGTDSMEIDIDRAMKGRTVLIIAHRLSTVRDASQVRVSQLLVINSSGNKHSWLDPVVSHDCTDCQVVVIEKGEVVEQGTHDQLIAQGGVYKQLVLRQLTAGELTNGNC